MPDHAGPALQYVDLDDDDSIAHLFAEQRARLATVREYGIWHWLGGVPSGFGRADAELHAVYLQLACVVFVAIALVVAGFTYGWPLWLAVGLASACLVLRAALIVPATRTTLDYYRRAELWPAYVVSYDPRLDDPANNAPRLALALLRNGTRDAAGLRALRAAGARLVALAASPPPALALFAAQLRHQQQHPPVICGREPLPTEVCRQISAGGQDAFELAFVVVWPPALPGAEFDSRLLFVLADPDRRDRMRTKVMQESLWGHGVAGLCAAMPLEAAS